jgi:hypothetical protein
LFSGLDLLQQQVADSIHSPCLAKQGDDLSAPAPQSRPALGHLPQKYVQPQRRQRNVFRQVRNPGHERERKPLRTPIHLQHIPSGIHHHRRQGIVRNEQVCSVTRRLGVAVFVPSLRCFNVLDTL